jgi:hypothetical protein
MPGRQSRWVAEHSQCQEAVNNLKRQHDADRARLEAIVMGASRWIEVAIAEHPELMAPGWVITLREG